MNAPLITPDVAQLLDILTYRRKHGTASEMDFINRYITPLNPQVFTSPKGEVLAYVVEVGEGSDTLFSCHTDTVHHTSGKQTVEYDPNLQIAYKGNSTTDRECLGADDGAGIWLLLQMIEARVPGSYIFHRAEECGGIGSRGMGDYYAAWLGQFSRAVAFDRRGTADVITHQAMGRCCSEDFAYALADMLNLTSPVLRYDACPNGIFTDTANYTHLIPECTNISCGYDSEHGPEECLDVEHLLLLRDACISVNWDDLPTERDMTVDDSYWTPASIHAYDDPVDDVLGMSFSSLCNWVRTNDVTTIADVISELADRVNYAEDAANGVSSQPHYWRQA